GRFVPALLERGLARVLRDHHVLRVELAVADHLHLRDAGDLLADELEDRAAEVAGDPPVGASALELLVQEGVVQPLAAGGKASQLAHVIPGAAPGAARTGLARSWPRWGGPLRAASRDSPPSRSPARVGSGRRSSPARCA